MNVGIAGTGRMGAAIATRLMSAGHKVTVWNRTAQKTRALADAGAAVAATPAELARGAEVVITILTDAAAIDAVYNGAAGLLSADVGGKLFIEMSTVRPDTERALAPKVAARGAALVECPVGGTVGPARDGRLIGLAGGDAADVARAKPILDQLCRRLEHVGPVGAGASMKLAINLPLVVFWQAFGEALALCRPLGLDAARMMDLFADTSGGPNVLKVRGQAVAAALQGKDTGPLTFDVDSARKDLRTMIEEGKALGVALPASAAALGGLDEAAQAGLGGADTAALPAYWANKVKVH
ncbi:MAG TPA: NAD(P)-dependent oxidoreductase [Burkholderiales bacterium]|nr:NAD(P)-dependent oxidoreductase [Burkholderiales bacterium]